MGKQTSFSEEPNRNRETNVNECHNAKGLGGGKSGTPHPRGSLGPVIICFKDLVL